MTRDEARALIAEIVHDERHGAGDWADAVQLLGGVVDAERVESARALADAVLDALFAQGTPEYRVVDKDDRVARGDSRAFRAVDARRPDAAPHRVQVRRVVFVSDEWRDETDG